MSEYAKPWLSVDEQIDRLEGHGIEIEDRGRAASVLQAVGYYRLTGYLYPFRESEQQVDEEGNTQIRVLSQYRVGTTLRHAEDIIDFDRRLRMLVMDGVERIEVAVRMRVGYVLGRKSPFAYEDPACFTEAFTSESTDARDRAPSKHVQWLQKVNDRRARSDEQFVKHFREKYDDRMPVWALTEILELGHLAVLYRGMHQQDAEEIALELGVPTKRLMTSWLASLNYVRNVAAHHSRLFNRKTPERSGPPEGGSGACPGPPAGRDDDKGCTRLLQRPRRHRLHPAGDRPQHRLGEAGGHTAAEVPDLSRPDDRVDGRARELGVVRPLAQLNFWRRVVSAHRRRGSSGASGSRPCTWSRSGSSRPVGASVRSSAVVSGSRHGRLRRSQDTATLRRTLINVPARVATSARRIRLHLPRTWPWETAWTTLFDRISDSHRLLAT